MSTTINTIEAEARMRSKSPVDVLFNAVSSVLFFASIALMLPIYPDGLPAWLHAW